MCSEEMVCGDQCVGVSTVRRWVRQLKRKSAVRKWFQKQNTIFLKDGFQKPMQRWRDGSPGGGMWVYGLDWAGPG